MWQQDKTIGPYSLSIVKQTFSSTLGNAGEINCQYKTTPYIIQYKLNILV